jgi:hypothetical protein
VAKELTAAEFQSWLSDVILPAFDREEEEASIADAPPGRFPRKRKLPREAWCQRLRALLEDEKAEELTLIRNEEKRRAHESIMSYLDSLDDDDDELRP